MLDERREGSAKKVAFLNHSHLVFLDRRTGKRTEEENGEVDKKRKFRFAKAEFPIYKS